MTQEELFKHIQYNPITGLMTRTKTRSNSMEINANSSVKINGVGYSAAKLAWLYVTGALPTKEIFTLDGTTSLVFDNLFEIGSLDETPVTKELLHKYFVYDTLTGNLIYKLRATKLSKIGEPAGTVSGKLPDAGYIIIDLFGKRYQAHRLVWMFHHGSFPDKQIDHINHNRTDNRLENLRLATNHTNMKNKSLYVTNTSGYSGVSKHGDNWKSRIGVEGTKVLLGVFKTFEEAVAARKAAEKLLQYHKNHGIINV